MAQENQKHYEFTRWYTGHVPVSKELGPGTYILDTIVLPVVRKDDADNKRSV